VVETDHGDVSTNLACDHEFLLGSECLEER
jgi:hypothetical protein